VAGRVTALGKARDWSDCCLIALAVCVQLQDMLKFGNSSREYVLVKET
jgi:hypothetical protein